MAADAVHKALEDSVPAMEYFMARSIFSRDEVKDIIKKRTAMEYILHGPRGSSIEEVTKALTYEKNLEVLRRRRAKRVPLKNRFDEHIIQRILNLYERFESTMHGEDRVDLAYDQVRWLGTVKGKDYDKKSGQILGRLITEHPTREDIYVFCARWEMERHMSIDNARALLQKGLRHVPQGRKLWRAYFMIELTYLGELLEKLREDPPEDAVDDHLQKILNGAIPRIVHAHCMEAFPQARSGAVEARLELTCDFLRISRKFPFTAAVQKHLCRFLEGAAEAGAEGGAPRGLVQMARVLASASGFFVLSSGAVLPCDYARVQALHDPANDSDTLLAQIHASHTEAEDGPAADIARQEVSEREANQALRTAFKHTQGSSTLALAAEAVKLAYELDDKLREHKQSLGEYLASQDSISAAHPYVVEAVSQLQGLAGGGADAVQALQPSEVHEVVRILSAFTDTQARGPLVAGLAAGFLPALQGAALPDKEARDAVHIVLLLAASLPSCGGIDAARSAVSRSGLRPPGGNGDSTTIATVPALQAYVLLCGVHVTAARHHPLLYERLITLSQCFPEGLVLPGLGNVTPATIVPAAVQSASQMNVGTEREASLRQVSRIAIVADPASSLKALTGVHKLPEDVAVQLALACIAQHDPKVRGEAAESDDKALHALKRRRVGQLQKVQTESGRGEHLVRQMFDALVKGPAGLGKSSKLWALWITWEQRRDVSRSLRLRAAATRMPGGLPAAELDSAVKHVSGFL